MANVKLILFYIFKSLEVILAATCIGLIFDPMCKITTTEVEKACLWMVAFACTIEASLTMIISQAAEDGVPLIASCLFLAVNAILNATAGGFIFKDWNDIEDMYVIPWEKKHRNMMLATGILAFINCLVLLVDMLLTIFLK